MKLKHRIRKAIIPAAAVLLRWQIRAICATFRLRLQGAARRRLDQLPEPVILACWHDQMALSTPLLLREIIARRTVTTLASHSDDGELISRIAAPLGMRVVRGSASRGGREGLRRLHQDLVRHQTTLFLTPDGPRGPAHVSKPGFVVLAQLARAPIVPMALASDRFWNVRSWDRLVLPKPWARIALAMGEPIVVPRQLETAHRDQLNERVQNELERLTRSARESLDSTVSD